MYEGRTAVEEGKVLGHENMGIVAEVGPGVTWVKPGDRVSVPFNVACGACRNCTHGWTSFCLRTNPAEGVDGAAYGYAQMGPYQGGQAEFLRVPFADFNLLPLPPGTDFERDFTMLSDIFPTGYHGAELAGVSPGDTVAVFGAGPVGLLAAHSSYLRGADRAQHRRTGHCRCLRAAGPAGRHRAGPAGPRCWPFWNSVPNSKPIRPDHRGQGDAVTAGIPRAEPGRCAGCLRQV